MTIKAPSIKFDRRRTLVSIVLVLTGLAASARAQDWQTVHPGVEYAVVTKEISGLNVNIDLLRLDLTRVRLDVVHAMDAAVGMEKTSSIATRHRAVAAVNAGFFRLDTSLWGGEDVSSLVIDHHLLSESNSARICLFIDNSGSATRVSMDRLQLDPHVTIGKNELPRVGIDRERKADDLVVYTPEFGRSTLTGPDGVEVVVRGGRVTDVLESAGSSAIPSDGFVISASGSRRSELAAARKGLLVQVSTAPADPEDIVSGIPRLIKDGKIDIDWQDEKTSRSFVETRHPRTAVAKLKDGKFLMITVDGRSESSGGIGLEDLAEYLLSLGATDAMNLDGGGSTTMFLDGKVVNHPSDKEGERRIGDALLVTMRPTRK